MAVIHPCDVQVWWWFELAITPTLVPGWNVVIIISIIIVLVADIVDLRIGATGEVGWTLVVFLTVVSEMPLDDVVYVR